MLSFALHNAWQQLKALWNRLRRVPIQAAEPEPLADWELEWDLAAETGEFTHILKDGPVTLRITHARMP